MSNILFATDNAVLKRLRPLIEDKHVLLISDTLRSALDLTIATVPDLIICAPQFDESRMLELLIAIKNNPRTAHVKFLCMSQDTKNMSPSLERILDCAANVAGSCGYVHACNESDEKLVRIIERLLATDLHVRDIVASNDDDHLSRQVSEA